MKKKATLYTAEGLAEKLDMSYSRLRAILSAADKETEVRGYRLIKAGNAWHAFDPSGIEVEVIDASPEFKKKNRKYRISKTKDVQMEPEASTSKEDTPEGEDGEETP